MTAGCQKVDGRLTAAAGAAVAGGKEKPHDHTDSDADGDSLIEMLVHCDVGGFSALEGPLEHEIIDVLAATEHGGETLAGFPDLISSHIGGGGNQGAGIMGQLIQILFDGLRVFVRGLFHGFGMVSDAW
jgi:hypothetical protein